MLQSFRRSGVQAITISQSNDNADKVIPNFIYNRFDLWTGHEDCTHETYNLTDGINNFYVQVLYDKETAELGLWMSNVPAVYVKELAHYIFSTHKEIQQIKFEKCLEKLGTCDKFNHLRIELPSSIEEFNQRLTHKFKYNMRREKKLLESEAGPLKIKEYSAENFPDDLFTSYFKLKANTHKRDYHMTFEQYIDTYHVSNAYVVRGGNGEIISLVLSCEQCPIAYIENLTYDAKYSKCSPGKMIYHYFLEALIRKGIKEIYLSGGNYEYKRHYGSIEEFRYTGIIHRHFHIRILFILKRELRRIFFEVLIPIAKKIFPAKVVKFFKVLMLGE